MRDTEFLGAGDPGALEAMLRSGTEVGARMALAEAYRRFGWRAASLDPLGLASPQDVPELEPGQYGLHPDEARPLRDAYCGSIGWQIGHVHDPAKRQWLAEQAEVDWVPDAGMRSRALALIAKSEHLETVFDRRMPGAKTFGLSGAESFLVLIAEVLSQSRLQGDVKTFVAGMHRGRLTQMALVFGKPLARIVADSMGIPEFPKEFGASSDSPYHLGWEGTASTAHGEIGVWVAPHPSHLSVVVPVAQGRARAKQDQGRRVLPIALHTDAAFAGQGVNAEVLQLSSPSAFDVGGTIHLILNNQIGFTTDPEDGRTASTIANAARMIDAPILHVNGEDPDAVLKAAVVANAWREAFGADIVVDLIGYRRKGHNEIDQPRFTQPTMYKVIDARPPLSKRYGEQLGMQSDLDAFSLALDAAFESVQGQLPNDVQVPMGLVPDIEARMLVPVETGLSADRLRGLGQQIVDVDAKIETHPKVAEFLLNRIASFDGDGQIDWATAEALALASMLQSGTPVRFGGQDSVRGAFSQRHLEVHCQDSGATWKPLEQFEGSATIHNTPLIENAVLAFEYGFSQDLASGLTIWEAQFGDFLNVAQAIFDQFIICGEDRWLIPSNLVMLLPHGVDGGGPDHATAHPERLLSACAKGNIQIVNPSTPANYFHALRRQVLADWRKPLVVLAPKTLLRHPLAKSPLAAFETRFQTVIAEEKPAERLVFSTGKLAVLLEQERDKTGADVALARLEQLYPLDLTRIADIAAKSPDAELIWAQEEPENMGYFMWLDRKLEAATGRHWRCVSRPASPSASAGPKKWDDAYLADVIRAALGLEDQDG